MWQRNLPSHDDCRERFEMGLRKTRGGVGVGCDEPESFYKPSHLQVSQLEGLTHAQEGQSSQKQLLYQRNTTLLGLGKTTRV